MVDEPSDEGVRWEWLKSIAALMDSREVAKAEFEKHGLL